MQDVKKVFSRIGFAYALYWIVAIFAQTMLMVALLFWFMLTPELTQEFQTGVTLILSTISMYIFGFPVFWLVIREIPVLQKPREQKWSLWSLITSFIISMGILYIGNIIGAVLMYAVGAITGNFTPNALTEMINTIHPGIIFFMMVIAAPIMEELMFRKMLLDRIFPYGEEASILISGLIFALAHGNFYQFFYAFALGAIFAYIYIKTGKIQYTIIFHMIINFCGSVLPIFLLKTVESQILIGGILTITFYLFILGFIVLGIWLLIKNRKKIVICPGLISKGGEVGYKPVFLNWGMAAYLVVCLFLFVIGANLSFRKM